MHDLAIIITAMNEGRWLRALLPTIDSHVGDITVDVVVADIESTDDTAELVDRSPIARRVDVINRGFAHANNVALVTTDARYVLFLNADTEIVDGTFAELVTAMDQRPEVGMLGVLQLDSAGDIYPTMRRFASPARILAEALYSEKVAPAWGQRVLDMDAYRREVSCDWTIGSFMMVRAEALLSAGCMDERFFFTGEEQDFCLRIRNAGWDIRHLPTMTIVHHVGKRGANPRFDAQLAFAERQYAEKHFRRGPRAAHAAALTVNYGLRSLPGVFRGSDAGARRKGARAALRVTLRRSGAPFMDPPGTGLPADLIRSSRESAAS